MSSLVGYEPLVDSTTDVYIKRTKELFLGDEAQRCDFSRWLQYYAFDVIGELTWSRRLGYIEKNEDVDGIIGFLQGFLNYAALVRYRESVSSIFCADSLLGRSNALD